MIHPIPPKPLAELRALVTAQNAAQQRVVDFGRACAMMLNLDASDPAMRVNLDAGQFETPDPVAATAGP
jgi:hypothetical protein